MGGLIDRTGETKVMNCGLKATIVKYRNHKDIDVLFENEHLVCNKQYYAFKNGNISYHHNTQRTGEIRTMNNGLKATIINYIKAMNIDIQFENGQICYNERYNHFKKGRIKCPLIMEYIDNYAKITNANTKTIFLIDKEDIQILGSRFWHSDEDGYIVGKINGDNVKLHRLIMGAKSGECVDHINGDRTDCRRKNLRPCTQAENTWNRLLSSRNTSGYKGVVWDKKVQKWKATVKQTHLGYFDNKIDAACAYDRGAIKHFGEFAKLNFIISDYE